MLSFGQKPSTFPSDIWKCDFRNNVHKNCSFTLLLSTSDAVVLANSRLMTMHRLPEDRNLKQQRCENPNKIIAALRVILYLCKIILYLKW